PLMGQQMALRRRTAAIGWPLLPEAVNKIRAWHDHGWLADPQARRRQHSMPRGSTFRQSMARLPELELVGVDTSHKRQRTTVKAERGAPATALQNASDRFAWRMSSLNTGAVRVLLPRAVSDRNRSISRSAMRTIPSASTSASASRSNVPAAVRRTVWSRDGW